MFSLKNEQRRKQVKLPKEALGVMAKDSSHLHEHLPLNYMYTSYIYMYHETSYFTKFANFRSICYLLLFKLLAL